VQKASTTARSEGAVRIGARGGRILVAANFFSTATAGGFGQDGEDILGAMGWRISIVIATRSSVTLASKACAAKLRDQP
jgi:hypothetical protein